MKFAFVVTALACTRVARGQQCVDDDNWRGPYGNACWEYQANKGWCTDIKTLPNGVVELANVKCCAACSSNDPQSPNSDCVSCTNKVDDFCTAYFWDTLCQEKADANCGAVCGSTPEVSGGSGGSCSDDSSWRGPYNTACTSYAQNQGWCSDVLMLPNGQTEKAMTKCCAACTGKTPPQPQQQPTTPPAPKGNEKVFDLELYKGIDGMAVVDCYTGRHIDFASTYAGDLFNSEPMVVDPCFNTAINWDDNRQFPYPEPQPQGTSFVPVPMQVPISEPEPSFGGGGQFQVPFAEPEPSFGGGNPNYGITIPDIPPRTVVEQNAATKNEDGENLACAWRNGRKTAFGDFPIRWWDGMPMNLYHAVYKRTVEGDTFKEQTLGNNPHLPNSITLKQWKAAGGKGTMTVNDDGSCTFLLETSGMIPTGYYTVWHLKLGTAPGAVDDVGAFGGVPNAFIPDENGNGRFYRKLPFVPEGAIHILYHPDHSIYGGVTSIDLQLGTDVVQLQGNLPKM